MVERHRDPQDRRRHATVLTEAGEKAAPRLAILADLDLDGRRLLVDLLHRAPASGPLGPEAFRRPRRAGTAGTMSEHRSEAEEPSVEGTMGTPSRWCTHG